MIFQVACEHCTVLVCTADIYIYFVRDNVNIHAFFFHSQSALIKGLDSSYDAQYRDPEFGYIKNPPHAPQMWLQAATSDFHYSHESD